MFAARSTINCIDKCHLVVIYCHKGQFNKYFFSKIWASLKNLEEPGYNYGIFHTVDELFIIVCCSNAVPNIKPKSGEIALHFEPLSGRFLLDKAATSVIGLPTITLTERVSVVLINYSGP